MTSRGRTLASTVLVIGARGSGLRTAIEVAERGVDVVDRIASALGHPVTIVYQHI